MASSFRRLHELPVTVAKRIGTFWRMFFKEFKNFQKSHVLIASILVLGLLGAWLILKLPGEAEAKQAAAALFGGSCALATFFLNKAQKQEHFEKQQEADRLRFDSQSLESHFTDILDRLASENVPIRANAAIRLAEMATQRWPGRSEEKTPENYPFFARAASQLAASLHLEAASCVRSQVKNAFARMSRFDDSVNQLLLQILILEAVNANHIAVRSFLETLGTVRSLQERPHSKEWLKELSPFAQICGRINVFSLFMDTNLKCLSDLAELKFTRAVSERLVRLRSLRGVDCYGEPTEKMLRRLDVATKRLKATQDSLATALRSLRPSLDCPEDLSGGSWKRDVCFSLEACVLSGADLSGAHLEGLNFSGAHLHGVQLRSANLSWTRFSGTKIQGANLVGTKLRRTNFEGADLSGSELHDCYPCQCDFSRSVLNEANFLGAKLYHAEFRSTSVLNTRVYRAQFQTGGDKAISLSTNWNDADFSQYSDERSPADNELKQWLLSTYPYEEEEIPF